MWIAGIDDALLGSPDPLSAFARVPPGARPVALWHEPDWAEHVVQHGAFVQLSGHSHGGQVRLPVAGAIAAPEGGRQFVHGLNFAAGMPIYTTRGVGVFRPPVRFRCPPEVTLVTLISVRSGSACRDARECHARVRSEFSVGEGGRFAETEGRNHWAAALDSCTCKGSPKFRALKLSVSRGSTKSAAATWQSSSTFRASIETIRISL